MSNGTLNHKELLAALAEDERIPVDARTGIGFDFSHMSNNDLQLLLAETLGCPSPEDAEFLKGLTHEITRRRND